MSELGETFKAWNNHKKIVRENNAIGAREILKENGIEYSKFSEDHFLVKDFDYWPRTGLFIHRKTKQRGRGVLNLIKKVKEP